MTRLSLLFIACLLTLLSGCQKSAVTLLKMDIAQSNKECPIPFGALGEIREFAFDDDTHSVIMYFTIDEDYLSINDMKNSDAFIADVFKTSLATSDAQEMIDMMVEADASLTLVFNNVINPDYKFSFTIPVDELRDLQNNSLSESEIEKKIISNQIRLENDKCPYDIDEGMTMTGVKEEDGYVVYTVIMDENLYDVASVKDLNNELKAAISAEFTDIDIKEFLESLTSVNMGIKYRYKGSRSSAVNDVTFSAQELRRFL